MTIDIKIRNPLTKEKNVLYAFSKEQAKKMIKSTIEEGWYVTIDENTEDIINELRKEKDIFEEKRDFGEDMLDFKTWRKKDNPGWYLSRESEESIFERYLDYVNQYKPKESDLEEDEYELCG